MLFAGLRKSEALGVRWQDVDLERGVLRVEQGVTELAGGQLVVGDTKSRFSRRGVHLPSVVAQILAGREAGAAEDRVCGTRPSNLSRYVNALGRRVLGRGVGCHELRRGFADLALDAGESELTVSRALGHSDLRLLHRVYAGRRQEAVLGAGRGVEAALAG